MASLYRNHFFTGPVSPQPHPGGLSFNYGFCGDTSLPIIALTARDMGMGMGMGGH